MKNVVSTLVVGLFMVWAGGSSSGQNAEPQGTVFTSSHGFSITPPDGWTVASKDGTHQLAAEVQQKVNGIGNVDLDRLAVLIFNPAETDQNLNVAILPHKEAADESGAHQLADGLRGRLGASVRMSVNRESFGANTAMVIDFDSNMSRSPDRTWMVILPAGDNALLVTCGAPQSSFEKVAPLFRKAIGSITTGESLSFFHMPSWVVVVVIALIARALFGVLSKKREPDTKSSKSSSPGTPVANETGQNKGMSPLRAGAGAKSAQNLCPICNHSVSRVIRDDAIDLTFPLCAKKHECQRCGCQWTPTYSRLSIAVFVVLCLASAVIVFFIDDSVYIHGRINDVSSDDKPIVFAGVIFSMAAGSWGLINVLALIRDPKMQITRNGVWPLLPDKLTPQAGGTVAESNVKKNEGQGPP